MKRALITGANRGIGFAIAKGLVKQGYEVLLGSRDFDKGKQVAEQIGAIPLRIDVADKLSIQEAINEAGDIDILINNAGILGSGSIFSDPEDFEASMAIMVAGPYELMRLTTPSMIKNNYGRIVNVSSGWGAFSDGVAGPGAYGVAKAGLNALTVSAARSLPKSVKVNAMCPGWVRTRMGGAGASRSPDEGADTAIWLATLPDSGPTGGFFRDRRPIDW